MHLTRQRLVGASILLAILLTSACGGNGLNGSTGATVSPNPTPTPVPLPFHLQNPLIVQIENLEAARPQSSLSDASVVYEYVTEGGITRFSVIFTTLPSASTAMGPVRSIRMAAIHITKMYNGILLYSGGSSYVIAQAGVVGIPNYNDSTDGGALFRIYTDGRQAPHNLYTNGANLKSLLAKDPTVQSDDSFWPRTSIPIATSPSPSASPSQSASAAASASPTSAAAAGVAATTITVPFEGGNETPRWNWIASADAYQRTEPGTGLFIDADTTKAVQAGTIILQQVGVSIVGQEHDVNGVNGVDYAMTSGSGNAQVFSSGKEYNATWTQSASGGPPQFTLPDGTAAPIAPGIVWICLVQTGLRATFH